MPESELLQWLAVTLVRYGPAVLFLVCLLETAIFAGLVLPVGALIAFSAMLASRGIFEPSVIVAVALGGAFVGDQLGFGIGRRFRWAARVPKGEARVWRVALGRMGRLVQSRGVFGISVARAIPFVRTVMPWFAGRSGISWGRFLLYDLAGVVIWGTIYIGGGFVAGQGWDRIAGALGEVTAAVVVILGVIVLLALSRGWLWPRIRRRGALTAGRGEPGPS